MKISQVLAASIADNPADLLKYVEELHTHHEKRGMYMKTFSCYYDSDRRKHIQITLFEGQEF